MVIVGVLLVVYFCRAYQRQLTSWQKLI